jgi:hypothetical protein
VVASTTTAALKTPYPSQCLRGRAPRRQVVTQLGPAVATWSKRDPRVEAVFYLASILLTSWRFATSIDVLCLAARVATVLAGTELQRWQLRSLQSLPPLRIIATIGMLPVLLLEAGSPRRRDGRCKAVGSPGATTPL